VFLQDRRQRRHRREVDEPEDKRDRIRGRGVTDEAESGQKDGKGRQPKPHDPRPRRACEQRANRHRAAGRAESEYRVQSAVRKAAGPDVEVLRRQRGQEPDEWQ
jgi:hypothetical protein